MKSPKELTEILSRFLSLDKRQVFFLCGMIMSMIVVRTISLPKIVTSICGGGKASSWYRRAQRFFSHAELDIDEVSKILFYLFFDAGEKLHLTLDRTNWKFGSKNINFLVLGAVYKGSAIPLMWVQLEKRGNSNTLERIRLIKRFIKVFGKSCIKELYGDREFVGKAWFCYLLRENIPFTIRIKSNTISNNSKDQDIPVKHFFRNLKRGEHRYIPSKRKIWEQSIFLSGIKLENGEFLIVASTFEPETATERYKSRWEIEVFFECLKGRGFNLEDTRITKTQRLEKLMAVVSLAYAWGHYIGDWAQVHIEPIKIKKHGRPEKRIFRYGIDILKQAILGTNFLKFWSLFLSAFDLSSKASHKFT